MEDARNGSLSNEIIEIFKPLKCGDCSLRFVDTVSLDSHVKQDHAKLKAANQLIPINLNLNQLREELKLRKLSTSGNKEILRRRLEGALAM